MQTCQREQMCYFTHVFHLIKFARFYTLKPLDSKLRENMRVKPPKMFKLRFTNRANGLMIWQHVKTVFLWNKNVNGITSESVSVLFLTMLNETQEITHVK